jgi:hypothetical protein
MAFFTEQTLEQHDSFRLKLACDHEPRTVRHCTSPVRSHQGWPAEADFILSALETAQFDGADRRSANRTVFRALAEMRFFSDRPGDKPWVLYTRDATTRGIGFITRRRLPLGHGGMITLRGPNGEDLHIACTIRRCHEAVNGWYEGSISFNREQWAFDQTNTKDAD